MWWKLPKIVSFIRYLEFLVGGFFNNRSRQLWIEYLRLRLRTSKGNNVLQSIPTLSQKHKEEFDFPSRIFVAIFPIWVVDRFANFATATITFSHFSCSAIFYLQRKVLYACIILHWYAAISYWKWTIILMHKKWDTDGTQEYSNVWQTNKA